MCFHRREQVPSLQIQMDQSSEDYYWMLQQQEGSGAEKSHHHNHDHFLPKRILQFVFSVSLFSFLLWYSYGCSILPREESINALFSTFIFSIFSHILERKYMFLIFNAILAFLVKFSLSIEEGEDIIKNGSLQSVNAIPVSIEEAPSLMVDQHQETDNKEEVSEDEEEDDEENIEEASSAKEDGDSNEVIMVGTTQDGVEVDVEEEEETTVAEENEELSNADELNRKFEEFIRKMKEEIRIEAQTQLVTAV